MRLSKRTTLAASIFAALLGAGIPAYAQHADHETRTAAVSLNVAKAGAAQRDLWLGHVFWVRNVAAETLDGNKAAAAAAENEVVANAKQIAASIDRFTARRRRTSCLTSWPHITARSRATSKRPWQIVRPGRTRR